MSVAESPTPEPFGLRGMMLGATKEEILAAIPDDAARAKTRLDCHPDDSGELCLIISEEKANGIEGLHSVVLGDVAGRSSFHFVPDQTDVLRADTIYWSGADLNELNFVLRPMTEKYGEPTVTPISVENGLGEKFDADEYVWDNGVSSIKLQTRCDKIREFCVNYYHTELVRRAFELDRAKKGDARSRL